VKNVKLTRVCSLIYSCRSGAAESLVKQYKAG